jgi:hypothetical protein
MKIIVTGANSSCCNLAARNDAPRLVSAILDVVAPPQMS